MLTYNNHSANNNNSMVANDVRTSERAFEGKDKEESKSFESSHVANLPNDDYFIVNNPLVLLICCSQYEGGWDPLRGVNTDHKILSLYDFFSKWD